MEVSSAWELLCSLIWLLRRSEPTMHVQPHPRFNLQQLSRLLLMALFSSAVNAAEVSTELDCVVELGQLVTVQQAAVKVADARFDLEHWKLQQLKALRERGHASWLEVARQQLTTDVLDRERAAMAEFCTLLRDLLKRLVPENVADRSSSVDSEGTPTPIKLSLSGSVRLVGWLDAKHTPPDLRDLLSPADSVAARSTDHGAWLQLASEQLQRAEQRCKLYASLESITADRRKQAELSRAFAAAELRFHQLAHDFHPDEPGGATLVVDMVDGLPRPDAGIAVRSAAEICLTPGSNFELGAATLRAAEAEANAQGHIQAAKIAADQSRLRYESLQQLFSRGHATREELDDARDQLARRTLRIEQLLKDSAQLRQAADLLSRSLRKIAATSVSAETPSRPKAHLRVKACLPGVPTWLSAITARWQFLGHALQLRREYLQAAAASDIWLLRRKMLGEYQARLQQSIDNTRNSSLTAGIQRQLSGQRLEMRYHQACHDAAQENMDILAAEERRFQEQCAAHQAAVNEASAVKFGFTASSLRAKHVSLAKPLTRGKFAASYLELECFVNPERFRLAEVREAELWWSPTVLDNQDFLGSDWTRFRRNRSRVVSDKKRRDVLWRDRRHGSPYHDHYSKRTSAPRRTRSLTSRHAYPFGILRSDLRSRLTLGQSPWYLPGSATNLRRRD